MATTTTTPRRRRYITRKFLVANNICKAQLALFDKHFPKGRALVTVARAVKFANVFDFGWLAPRSLSYPAYVEYTAKRKVAHDALTTATLPAARERDAAQEAAWAEWTKKLAAAWEKYSQKPDVYRVELVSATNARNAKAAAVGAEYENATAHALAEYLSKNAAAWAEAFLISEQEQPES